MELCCFELETTSAKPSLGLRTAMYRPMGDVTMTQSQFCKSFDVEELHSDAETPTCFPLQVAKKQAKEKTNVGFCWPV